MYDMEFTFHGLRTGFCPCALLMCGRADMHADEEPKDDKKRTMMCVLQKLEVMEKLDRGQKLLWSDAIMA
jgi:hypothetical protein